MSVNELLNKVIELEAHLSLDSEGLDYSTRLLILLEKLAAPATESVDETTDDILDDTPPELDSHALEEHLSRLKDIVGTTELDVDPKEGGTIEEIMARLEDQLEQAVHLND